MTPGSRSDVVELGDLVHRVRQLWFPVALLALLGLTVGLTVTVLAPTEYRASAVVFAPGEPAFLPVNVAVDNDPRPRVVTQDTEAAFVRSATVLAAASARSNTALAADAIDISVPTGTRALHIAYTADDPDQARRAAQLVAEEYVRVRNQYFEQRRTRQVDILVKRRDELRAELSTFRELIATLGWDSLRRSGLNNRQVALTTQLETLETELTEVVESGAAPAAIVRAADQPRRPVASNAEVAPITGLAVGALLAIVRGVRTDRRRDVIEDLRDVRAVSELPVLARLGRRGDAAELARLATEVRLRAPEAVLITDTGAHAAITPTLGERLRTALEYAPDAADASAAAGAAGAADRREPVVLARTAGADDGPMLRAARQADVTLIVVRLGRTRRGDLATVDRLLTHAGTRPALVVAGAPAVKPDRTSHG